MKNIETIEIQPTIAEQIGAPIEDQTNFALPQEHVLLDNTQNHGAAILIEEEKYKPIPHPFKKRKGL